MKPFTKPNIAFRVPEAARKSGGVLIPTLAILAALVAFAFVAFNFTSNVGLFADRSMTRQKAMAIADASLELQFAEWCAVLQYGITFAPPTSSFDNISLPTASMFPSVTNFSATSGTGVNYVVSNYRIQAVDPLEQPVPAGEKPTMISTNNTAVNLYHYLGTVDVSLPNRSGSPVTVRMSRIFQLQNRSPWSYAIFFDRDLEIAPGPAMSITGDVHSNGSLYVGAGGGAITFSGVVEASGNITKGKSDLDPSGRNNTNTTIVYPPGQPRTGVAVQTPLGINHSALNATDSNQNNDSYHEIIEPPASGSDPFTPPEKQTQRFYNMADYKVSISNASNDLGQAATVTVLDSSGATVSPTSNLYKVLTAGATISGKVYSPILTLTGTLQDNREAATMKLTTMNIGALKAAVDGGVIPAKAEGLLVYVNDTRPMKPYVADIPAVPAVKDKKGNIITPAVPAIPGNPKMEAAVFVDNGNILPDNGLTIVTGNPLYVQGDYNTGQTDTTNLPSNTSSGGAPTAANYWQPAALISDALTVLSNSWTTSSTSSSNATRTTLNAAVMAGNVPSDGVNYSGGVENFPRFLENWTNIRFTYYGSMVCLYDSQQAKEPWGKANVYSAPTRDWYFEKKFYTHTPPGTFMVPSYQKLRWFAR
ncbi:MAG: hypothetical protein WCP06_04995 [Verrucomicrobiota bacterium]